MNIHLRYSPALCAAIAAALVGGCTSTSVSPVDTRNDEQTIRALDAAFGAAAAKKDLAAEVAL